ncbi:MAG TPA: WD40 repeat domain-containing protein [Chthoniobacteraceae bacterium]|nr:WD40 repeat domain-containing protein [Chthoniobacteraceae bacterium]
MHNRLCIGLLSLCFFSKVDAAPVTALAFTSDDTSLLAASGEQVRVCAPQTGETLTTMSCHPMRVSTMAFSPDGALLAVGGGVAGENGEVRLFDWAAKKWLGGVAADHDLVTSVAFHPAGELLATASADNTVRIYRIVDHGAHLVEQWRGAHTAPVQAAAFSRDGKIILSASLDRSIKVWSSANGALLHSLGQHTDAVHSMAVRPSADAPLVCATAGDDRTVRIWQPSIGRMIRIVRKHEGAILALVFAPDGGSLYSAGQEGIVRQIDAESDAILAQWQASTDWIYTMAIAHDGRLLATGDWHGRIQVKAVR